jgi:hypothetical protein
VRAAALNEAESEALTSQLARLQPRPVLRLTTEQDLADELADASTRIAAESHAQITPRYVGAGRVRLDGRVGAPGERDKVVKAFRDALPLVRDWDVGIQVNTELAALLVADLRARGDWDITSTQDNGAVDMRVDLHERQLPQWEAALAAAVKANPAPFHAQLAFKAAAAGAPPAAAVSTNLPFDVRGVIGGENPYVVLLGGEKLARGGTWKGWRLVEISSNQVVFDNDSRRAIVQR